MATKRVRRRLAAHSSLVGLLLLFFLLQNSPVAVVVVAWNTHSNNQQQPPNKLAAAQRLVSRTESSSSSSSSTGVVCNRRQWISSSLSSLATTFTTVGAVIVLPPLSSQAACLPGDLSKDCIGVYKVPMDDRSLPYFSTPEALQKFAPDLRYVPPIPAPTSLAQAWDILDTQRLAADDIQQVVQAGRLEEAGIKVLNLVPKVTSSGKMILDDALQRIIANKSSSSSSNVVQEMTMNRLESQWEMVVALWGESDVMIGQGLKGDLGVSAVAQLQILKQLQEANAALDDFMASAAAASGKRSQTK
jgi:hypothetical protein